MDKTKRDKKGRFVSQGECSFDSKTGKETAEEHSWSNRRKQTLKRLGLWEEVNNE